jgi:SagB-type dehydrogenase family enzyme
MNLDRTSFPAWLGRLQSADASPRPPRRYPGYPEVRLPRMRRRWLASLDGTLLTRRSAAPGASLPSAPVMGRLLGLSHGVTAEAGRGPVPSAGGLQAIELYLGVLTPAWLGPGVWHYARQDHLLSRVSTSPPEELVADIPSLQAITGGAIIWLIVGDTARVTPKYGERGRYFLALEAGHLMQNLCLVSASLGLVTLPLGGFFEASLARRLSLPPTDDLLYAGVCGPLNR